MRWNDIICESKWSDYHDGGEHIICWYSGLHLWNQNTFPPQGRNGGNWKMNFTPTVEHLVPKTNYKTTNFKIESNKAIVARCFNNCLGSTPLFIKLEFAKRIREYLDGRTTPLKEDAEVAKQIRDVLLHAHGVTLADMDNLWRVDDPSLNHIRQKEISFLQQYA